ncbi:hypothetical protein EDF35_1921 [Rathayibacter sp. PhB151]|uniref:hypothetical protein n=1 Tax=Rathayibacter sp. PhB151 TaxID=2485189 RepID=UPI001063FFF5|nr:hypothetical protein [Rathayibacter sp. PhB151]TDX78707.1 hypothetical protein EDF35_1921 [Rathayibacter sp. PhB151]
MDDTPREQRPITVTAPDLPVLPPVRVAIVEDDTRTTAIHLTRAEAETLVDALQDYLFERWPRSDCEAELWSWDYFRHGQTDPYWMRCNSTWPHEDDHENSDTGAHWPLTEAEVAAARAALA